MCYVQMPARWVEVEDKRRESLSIAIVIFKTCIFYGVQAGEVISKNRKASLVSARHMCWYLLRKHTNFSLSNIGSHFDVDHTTVIAGVNRVRGYLKVYPAIVYEEKLLTSILLNNN